LVAGGILAVVEVTAAEDDEAAEELGLADEDFTALTDVAAL
jgi:hypothetical protein